MKSLQIVILLFVATSALATPSVQARPGVRIQPNLERREGLKACLRALQSQLDRDEVAENLRNGGLSESQIKYIKETGQCILNTK